MTKFDSENFGTCKLCRRKGELRDSHIISEFLYASIYDDKHRFHAVAAGELQSSYEQKGYRERMVCQSCETKLSKWETYARGLLTGGTLLQYRREGTITWVEGIDYSRFKLVQRSILWRAGVATPSPDLLEPPHRHAAYPISSTPSCGPTKVDASALPTRNIGGRRWTRQHRRRSGKSRKI
jgi:hypothetical protein